MSTAAHPSDSSAEALCDSKGLKLKASVPFWWSWTVRHAVPILASLFFCAYVFVFYREFAENQWQLYRRAAHRLQAHEMINVREGHMYSYPPAMAMFSIPLASLPEFPSHGGWYLVNVVALCVTVVSAWRLSGGGALVGIEGHWRWVFGLGLLLAGRHLISPLENHQYDMVIAAFLMGGCLQLLRGREILGGCLVGISASMKLTPILFAPYLIWRGRPKAAAAVVIVAAGLNLIPDLAWPQTAGGSYLSDWHRNCLSSVVASPGKWLGDQTNILNQSLAGLVNRAAWTCQKADLWLARPLGSKWFLYALQLTLAGVTAWRMGRPFRGEPPVPADEPRPISVDRLRHAWECSAVMCLMVLLSPMTSKAHYAPLVLPTFFIVRMALERKGRAWTVLAVLLTCTGVLATKGLLGRTLGEVLLFWGVPTGYALASLVGCWLAIEPARQADDRPTTPQGTHWGLSRRALKHGARR